MSPRGRFNLVMGLLVAGALAFGFWRWRQQAQGAAVSAQIAAHAIEARTRDEDKNRVGTAREERGLPFRAPPSSTPLPPWGEPLGANFDALRRRADVGDARAACRIGVELSRCAAAQAQMTTPPGGLQNPPGTPATPASDCDAIDASVRGQAASYLRKAALAGNTDAMLRYASGTFSVQAVDPHSPNEFLQDPVFGDWYNEALPMVQRALHAGDPLAVQMLANAYADDDGLFDARVPNDPVQARAYVVVLAYLRNSAPPPSDLDARQRAQADAQAQRIYRESFGSQPVQDSRPTDPGLNTPSPGQRTPCE